MKILGQSFASICLFVLFFYSQNLSAKIAAIVIDYDTKEVLFEINADTRNYPASLVKMMTLYILFDNLEKGKITEKTALHVSAVAASRCRYGSHPTAQTARGFPPVKSPAVCRAGSASGVRDLDCCKYVSGPGGWDAVASDLHKSGCYAWSHQTRWPIR